MAQLNEGLAKKQKITQEQRDNLYNLYDYMYELIAQADKISEKEKMTPEKGKEFSLKMKELEFNLQDNWNFDRSELHHTWWNKFSGCTCPKMDNDERFGYDKIINSSCVYHGI